MVLDATVAIAWCFEDERNQYTDFVLDRLGTGAEAAAPSIWPYEIANALVVGERRGRITPPEVKQFLERLSNYPVVLEPPWKISRIDALIDSARASRLATYDAAYLELALRMRLPLVTLDAQLRAAARKAGLPVALPR